MADSGYDARAFRNALGCFATGVTVVTTRSSKGEAVGMTVSSFNSVSLQPPMVLWSLARDSHSLPVFNEASHWVVHVLAADQEALSRRFAARGADKFAGLPFDEGVDRVPLLRGCAARFQCRTAFQYDGGDHVIFVGQVVDFDSSTSAPLVFHGGRYALALPRSTPESERESPPDGSFSKDYLGYLLGRGFFLLKRQLTALTQQTGISDEEHFVLAALAVHERLSVAELEAAVGDLLLGRLREVLAELRTQGHIRCTDDAGDQSVCELAPSGRERALYRIAVAKSFESQVIEHFGVDDTFALKSLLRKLVGVMTARRSAPRGEDR